MKTKRVLVSDILKKHASLDGKSVVVRGWARTVRDSKSFGFLELNDGSAHASVQVVFERERLKNYDDIARLNVGAAVTVEGTLVCTPQNRQPCEIKAAAISVDGASAPDYPLQKKGHTMEFLRSKAHLRPRTNTFNAVFRIRSLAAFAVHKFFNERGFIYVHTPVITSNDCEGAGEMFRVTVPGFGAADGGEREFFGKKVGLTVSGQLHAESFAMAFPGVYTFGPTFRAENSNTARHAAEFWMIEPEIAFCDLKGDMDAAEAMIKYIVSYILKNASAELEFLNRFIDAGLLERLRGAVRGKFARITYTKAVSLLQKARERFEFPADWGCDLQSEHERYLSEEVFKKPVFVTDYPKSIKPFYMRCNADGKTVAACDLLAPGIGELVGGGQREERVEVLEARMREMKMNFTEYGWYADLRKFGGAEHAGFGLGFERMIMYLTGVPNIRDVIPFPRTAGGIAY